MKIGLLSTGGTIAMAQKPGEKMSSLSFDANYFAEEMLLAETDALSVIDHSQLPSSNFDSNYASLLADKILQLQASLDGIIITHGTDTMEETAFYLDLVLGNQTPVVLTGAMMTGTQPGYDGVANLRNALKVIKSSSSAGKGVLIVFNRDIICAVHAAKVDSERPNAFGSLHTGKIGSINGDGVFYYYEAKRHVRLENRPAGVVCLIRLHYDIDPELVALWCNKADIVVIECLGSGRVPPKLLPILENQKGKTFILSTRILGGHLYDEYSYDGSYQYFLKRKVILSPLNGLKSCILARLCRGNGMAFEEMKGVFENFFL